MFGFYSEESPPCPRSLNSSRAHWGEAPLKLTWTNPPSGVQLSWDGLLLIRPG